MSEHKEKHKYKHHSDFTKIKELHAIEAEIAATQSHSQDADRHHRIEHQKSEK